MGLPPIQARLHCPRSFIPSDRSNRMSWWDTGGRTPGEIRCSHSYSSNFVSHSYHFVIREIPHLPSQQYNKLLYDRILHVSSAYLSKRLSSCSLCALACS